VAVHVLAIAGGVGGAKLALGLSRHLAPDALTIVVNTGDDETFHGLHVSPDLDTVMYTLAGVANPETGWGLAGESFRTLGALERLGADTWFRLGDLDLATHIRRTEMLQHGLTLSQATRALASAQGIRHPIVPMSDDRVRTIAVTEQGDLAFQEYFVHRRSEPCITVRAFFTDVDILHLCGPIARHLFRGKTEDGGIVRPFSAPFSVTWRNHAHTARLCFDDATWQRYWWPGVFGKWGKREEEREFHTPEVIAQHSQFASYKQRSDEEFWRGLIGVDLPWSRKKTGGEVLRAG